MPRNLPTRVLRDHPDLGQLRRQARELLDAFRAADPAAVSEVSTYYREADPAAFALHDAQLVLARAHGFDSWPKLKAYVDGVTVKRLVEAVQAGDSEAVRAVLRVRPELVNTVTAWNNEHTALHHAVFGRMPEMVRLLMEHGADARAGISPHNDATGSLTIARERCYEEIVDIIRKAEDRRDAARPGPREDERQTLDPRVDALRSAVARGDEAYLRERHALGELPLAGDQGGLLELAVEQDRPAMVRLLLGLGLDPDARARVDGLDEVAFTWGMPLWLCARRGKHEMARLLLEAGADSNAQVYASGTPLSEAYGHRDEEMIGLLERFGGRSNAAMAGMYRREDLARRLLAEGGPIDQPDDGFGSGPVAEQLLGAAARGGDPVILRMAMERVDFPREDPRWAGLLTKPLEIWNHGPWPWVNHEWDRRDYLTCFAMILERCGPPNVRLRFGATILHEVAASLPHVTPEEQVAFATMLLDAGARTDLRDDLLRSTPLGWACRWGRTELVKLLLERGADPVEADAEPWATPRAWAQKMRHDEVLTVLQGHGP